MHTNKTDSYTQSRGHTDTVIPICYARLHFGGLMNMHEAVMFEQAYILQKIENPV